MACIYCSGRRNDPEMTLEHIWPQALGGAASPELFRSREVCARCNNLAGLWVDGAFLKSWFTSHETGAAARAYMDPVNPCVLPFTYMGADEQFPKQAGDVCERYIGPAGEHGYHIHLQDDEKWYGYAGGDVIRRQRDTGRAYLILTSQNSYWVLTGIKSFISQFAGSRLFCLTNVQGWPPELSKKFTSEENATEIEKAEIAWIKSRPDDKMHLLRFSVRLDFQDRFLAKVALGLGCSLFDHSYRTSPYAEELRKLLWRGNPNSQPPPAVRGMNFLTDKNPGASKFIGVPGAWTILLQGGRDAFALFIVTPGGRGMGMAVSDDVGFWRDPVFKTYQDGVVYAVVPERAFFSQPISLLEYVSHKTGNRLNPELLKIESFKCDPAALPKMR